MSGERHFRCTACGKCCHGWLPLTLADALAHAGRFPLAVAWTPVKPGARAYELTARLGLAVRLGGGRDLAVRLAPTAVLPPAWPCPALDGEGLCSIQDDKPSRCRTMPFFPYQDEADQAANLVPRPGWACDTSAAAPVVYRDKAIVERADFDRERAQLLAQAPALRAYAEALLARTPGLADTLAKAVGRNVLLGFAGLLKRLDRPDVAAGQLAVLRACQARAAADPALAGYARDYGDWAWEMEPLAAPLQSGESPS